MALERDGSCVIMWNVSELTLDQWASFTQLLVELHSEVAVPYVTTQLYQLGSNVSHLAFPTVASVRMGSPLVAHLFTGSSAVEVAALGMIGIILKNPKMMGEFLPQIKESWYKGNRKALEEKIKYLEVKGRLDARGRSIERFERQYIVSKPGPGREIEK